MTVLDWTLMSLATVMSLAGLALLFLSWKRPGRPAAIIVGWAFLSGALGLAFFANTDRGVAQISVILMLVAVAWFTRPLFSGVTPPRALSRRRNTANAQPTGQPVLAGLSGFWTFVICGPVAGGIAFYAAAALFKILRPENGSPANAGIIAVIVAVCGWALASTLLLIEPRPGRRSVYAGAALAAAVTVALV
ncbi:hypothetical protein [Henriciella sp.]|uniref:hypothetical protein n=1 Tax=Henriciella sp. TaxID=1968823 RepID=UPI002614976A|nr:hypothetical protein [Henriciella sp.]